MSTGGKLTGEALERTIARLVREALGQLETPRPSHESPERAKNVSSDPPELAAETHSCPEKLISLETLAAIPAGARTLRIAPHAVLTPSAREELKARGIAVQHAAADAPQHASPTPGVASAMVCDRLVPERAVALCRQLATRGLAAETFAFSELESTAGDHLCLLLSELPARDCDHCARQLNRLAATTDSLEMAQRIGGEMRPQVWVLDTARLTFSALTAVAERCLRISAQPPPTPRRKPR
jgi:hypothetical protein